MPIVDCTTERTALSSYLIAREKTTLEDSKAFRGFIAIYIDRSATLVGSVVGEFTVLHEDRAAECGERHAAMLVRTDTLIAIETAVLQGNVITVVHKEASMRLAVLSGIIAAGKVYALNYNGLQWS